MVFSIFIVKTPFLTVFFTISIRNFYKTTSTHFFVSMPHILCRKSNVLHFLRGILSTRKQRIEFRTHSNTANIVIHAYRI